MLIPTLPLSVFASMLADVSDTNTGTVVLPKVIVTSKDFYSEGNKTEEYRALPDADGRFYFDIKLDGEYPSDGSDIVVYYRTVDDSAVAKWGDYESVEEGAFVTLSPSNLYTARVSVASKVLDYGFVTDVNGTVNNDKLVTRRFIFEVLRAEGKVDKSGSTSKFYCYLRAKGYNYQNAQASVNSARWQTNAKDKLYAQLKKTIEIAQKQHPYIPPYEYAKYLQDLFNTTWNQGTADIPYDSFYYSAPSMINTPWIYYKGDHKDEINLEFDEEWYNYVASGVCDLGISINGTITREYWDSDGDATFHLYYNYQGEKKLALSLYLQGEFDDSEFFGWEHAFEYAIEGLEGNNRDDHMDENFIGFTLYDNDGKVLHEVKANSRSDIDEDRLCGDLKKTIRDNYATKLMAEFNDNTKYNDNLTAYYLKLPSNFALADSYSYEFISDSTSDDEIRWLENVMLSFALIGNKRPAVATDAKGIQMVTTNIETLKEGDPLRMSVRFDRPVYVHNPDDAFCITADIYNDKGTCLVKGLELKLKQLGGNSGQYYAWDTLVFESKSLNDFGELKIASLRNIKISENGGTVKSFFTNTPLAGLTLNNIACEKDMRTPEATVNPTSSDNWARSKSVDVSVYVKGHAGARFIDFVTVYYEWSKNPEAPTTPDGYSSKLTFHMGKDGDVLKTIIGTGSGETYLHMMTVSAYGKSSVSTFGKYKFDNSPPTVRDDQISITGSLKNKTVKLLSIPDDKGESGFRDISLYFINSKGESELLKKFEEKDFADGAQPSYEITHDRVEIGVDANGNGRSVGEVDFYWVIIDKLGNSSGRVSDFSLVFDINNYISDDVILGSGPLDFLGDGEFLENPKMVKDRTYIYDYTGGGGSVLVKNGDKKVYYGFGFSIDGQELPGDKKEYYDILISYNGTPLEKDKDYTVDYINVKTQTGSETGEDGEPQEIETSWKVALWLNSQIASGRYDIRLTRSGSDDNEAEQISQLYTVYATNNQKDKTEIMVKIGAYKAETDSDDDKRDEKKGTLLTNSVYQLSVNYPYFYYKGGKEYYNDPKYEDTRQPATFSSLDKAMEYVRYRELGDIYLVKLTATTASSLINGTSELRIANGETVVPQEGQHWIRYKSEAWTPESVDSAWVYYYYGDSDSDVLSEGALSINLKSVIDKVAKRIVGYGKELKVTDASLFLGSAMGDKLLDSNGMPYLLQGQIHCEDELSDETVHGSKWSSPVLFAADTDIYMSKVYLGAEEYSIVGNFPLPEESIFQYVASDQYKGDDTSWQMLNNKNGASFFNSLSGLYKIREISKEGVSVYDIYVDKEAPKVTFSHSDDDGDLREIPIDGVEILEIRTKDLYIGRISALERDSLSYVAVYKSTNLSLVDVYMAADLSGEPVKLEDGNYYIVVADRSGNHYTVTAKVSSTELECNIKESEDRYIRLTCNRKPDQIRTYEVYLFGELVTSTYSADQTFERAGLYTIYIQDIYGNEYSKEWLFERNYPTVTWKYYGEDGKYHTYDSKDSGANGFMMTQIYDNQHKISTSVKTRFSFSENYDFEFVGTEPQYTKTIGAETVVTIEEGQSFVLKVYYKNHKDCYSLYSGVVDVTPPSINVSAEVEVLENGEYNQFQGWIKNGVQMKDIYFVLSEIGHKAIANGEVVSSDMIRINASDSNNLSLLEVYLDDKLIEKKDGKNDVISGSLEIKVGEWGKYRIVAKDSLGNTSEFTFTNGMPDDFDYFVDGAEKSIELHGYLNFKPVNGKQVYTKVDYGKSEFRLDLKKNSDVFMSVGVSGKTEEIYGFRISDGQIYPLTYKITLDKNNVKSVELSVGKSIIDTKAKDFKNDKDYLISKSGAYAVYASISKDKVVSIRVYAPESSYETLSVGARVGVMRGGTYFVSSELSKKRSVVSFAGLGPQKNDDVRVSRGFTVDETAFESERIESVRLYYSKLNDLDASDLSNKTNIYVTDKAYENEGFYLMIVRNLYGNERAYRIIVSRSFGVTASVIFGDGYKILYSKDYAKTLYSDNQIVLDLLDENVKIEVTENGKAYTGFSQKKEGNVTYVTFSESGKYKVVLTDSFGNTVTKQLEINKSAHTVSDDLLTGYNEKALKRHEGYTNQKLTVDKAVYDSSELYYLAIRHGDQLTVLFDAFSEKPVVTDDKALIGVVGAEGDGDYTVICRNRYGAVVTKVIHYRGTPTLKLERTIRSKTEAEIYDLSQAVSIGFWSNNTLSFSTEAKTYEFKVNKSLTECPKTLVFENAGDFGSFEYEISYIDEYGFEYSFKAYLVRKDVELTVSPTIKGMEIDGVLNTRDDISVTFGENIYATYTVNNGEENTYRSGDLLKKDGTYRFTVTDYAGNVTSTTLKKDTAVEFSFTETASGSVVQNGGVVNSSRIKFDVLNKDSAYIEKVLRDGELQEDFTGDKFEKDGKWEIVLGDKLGNKAYFSFYVVTRARNGFAYTTPYEYRITELWYDGGDGVKVSYLSYVKHDSFTSSFDFKENGKYTVIMASDVSGATSSFEFTVNTNAPEVSLVGCENGETTLNDISVIGYKVGDTIRVYRATRTGEELVSEVEVTSLSTKIPTVTEGGTYRIVVESEAGIQTELSFVRKHVMNTAGNIFVLVVIGLAVIGLFTGLIYRNKSKTDD